MLFSIQKLTRINQRLLTIAWLILGISIFGATQLCSTIWAFANPTPHHWDNAIYLNHACEDLWAYTNGGPTAHHRGLRGVFDSMLNSDPYIPPAYRFVSAPFIFSGVRMLALLRAVSLACFWLTLYVIYQTGRIAIDGPAGRAAGITAAMLVGLYSEIGWSIRIYGTEHTLYFSTALMLYCLTRSTRDTGEFPGTWIGLGFALGLGILSKISFVLLAAPALAVALLLIFLKRLPGLSLLKMIASVLIAILMAWPFYHLHFHQAMAYAQDMTQFQRHSLHKTGLGLLAAWARLHITEGLGTGAATVIAALLVSAAIALAARWMGRFIFHSEPGRRGSENLDAPLDASGLPVNRGPGLTRIAPAGLAILIALAQGIPLLLFQLLFSKNDNVRHMTPAYLPLTLAVTLTAAWAGVLMSGWSWAVLIACAIPAFTQVLRNDIPITTTPDDVWNWEPLYAVARQYQIRSPMIGHMGNAGQFCDPAIIFPWERRGQHATSRWLWRPEDGTYDPASVEEKLADCNLLITAPDFHMPAVGSMLADPFEADNFHNTDFARQMQHDPPWQLAAKFPIGTVNPANIWVFVRK